MRIHPISDTPPANIQNGFMRIDVTGCREADQIHIIALSNALEVGISVVYLDSSGSNDEVTLHRFGEDYKVISCSDIGLLYRPGMTLFCFPSTCVHQSRSLRYHLP
jgi:hypothetical protein